MKNKNRGIKKAIRDEIMIEIALQYRENQKSNPKLQKVNLFPIWIKHNMLYSDFLNVILSLELKGYLHYEKARDNAQKAVVGDERVPQEFVFLEPNGKSFPETLSDEKEDKIRNNLKYPIIVSIIGIIVGILLSSKSLSLLSKIAKWFLSLFHS